MPTQTIIEEKGVDLDTEIKIDILIQNPEGAQIGMLLLLLKDLWTGDLPLGGESSVGRGRLCGKSATLTFRSTDLEPEQWIIKQATDGVDIDGNTAKLEGFVNKFQEEMTG